MRAVSKDHAGGALPPNFTRLPVEWHESQAIPIAITQPEFPPSLPEEVFAELLHTLDLPPGLSAGVRQTLADALAAKHRELMDPELIAARNESAVQLITILIDEDDRLAVALAFAAGLPCAQVRTGPEWAAHYGVTKQAFAQQVDKLRGRFNLKSRTMRDETGREHMSEAYWSRRKKAGSKPPQ